MAFIRRNADEYNERIDDTRYAENRSRKSSLGWLPLLLLIPLLLVLGLLVPRLTNTANEVNDRSTISQESPTTPAATDENGVTATTDTDGGAVANPTGTQPQVGVGGAPATSEMNTTPTVSPSMGMDEDMETSSLPQSGVGGSGENGSTTMPSGAPNTGRGK